MALEPRAHATDSVEAGRAYVSAYVEYLHFVEELHGLLRHEALSHGDTAAAQGNGQGATPRGRARPLRSNAASASQGFGESAKDGCERPALLIRNLRKDGLDRGDESFRLHGVR